MTVALRPYQENAVTRTLELHRDGVRSVCLVAGTGAGKTVMGSEAVRRAGVKTVWLTHRGELVDQSLAALEKLGLDCGTFAAGRMVNLEAPVIVMGWQTALGRSELPPADLLVIDECHHARGEEWQRVIEHYPRDRTARLGLTATPQRGDGKPLGDVFDELVIAANYSELLRDGYLVPCRVFRPDQFIAPDLSKEPLEAYMPFAPRKGIGFARSVELGERYAEQFRRAGIKSYCIDGTTGKAKRRAIIEDFADGHTRFLWSIGVLTEGFNVPDAEVCVLARGVSFTGTMMQMGGRVLRPAEGKTHAVFIDLPGVTWKHGLPTEDRHYSLEGKAIESLGALAVCAECGTCFDPKDEETGRKCPLCGYLPPAKPAADVTPKIYNLELQEVFHGEHTSPEHKAAEWKRLLGVCLA